MGKLVKIPELNQMTQLECDECESSILTLYLSKDFTTLAFKCVSCGYVGYAISQEDED